MSILKFAGCLAAISFAVGVGNVFCAGANGAVKSDTSVKKQAVAKKDAGISIYTAQDDIFTVSYKKQWHVSEISKGDDGTFQIEIVTSSGGIWVTYHTPDSPLVSPKSFIERTAKDPFGKALCKVKQTNAAGRKASVYSYEEELFSSPSGKSSAKFVMRHKYYVMPAKVGFYVIDLEAKSPTDDSYAQALKDLDYVVSTFKGKY